MGIKYTVFIPNATLVVGSDVVSIISAANRSVELTEVTAVGRGATSIPYSLRFARTPAGTTPTVPTTPFPADIDSPASVSTTATVWAVQPAMGANDGVGMGGNQLGGMARWLARGDERMRARNGGVLSIRAQTTGSADVTVIYEDI